ncbi:MAG: exosortase system-associated protein, TIGR04073 family [Candidatus Hydrogenedentota bacterium]
MHKRPWLLVTVALLIGVFLVQGPLAVAQDFNPDQDLPKPTGMEKALTKLGRGISNILLGWAEIPVTWDRSLNKGKPLGYLVGVAPVLGTARAVIRTGTGVFEVVSFPFSDEDVNYEAVLEPDYIF